jgi:hypothetical protein
MTTETPSDISLINGRYAEGKKIRVIFPKASMGADIVLKGLERFREDQQPGESITLQCRTVLTEKGEFTDCQVSLTRDFANH